MTALATEPTVRRRLFETAEDIRLLNEALDATDGEMTPGVVAMIEEGRLRSMDRLEQEQDNEINRLIEWVDALDAEAGVAAKLEEQYARIKRSRLNRIKWIKDEIIRPFMEVTNQPKIKTTQLREARIQQNGGSLPVILAENLDPSTLPDDLAIVRRTPDLDAIRKRLEAIRAQPAVDGEPAATVAIPGIAVLGERGSHLRLK